MKEFLVAGAMLATVTLGSERSETPVWEVAIPDAVQAESSEGFVPHRGVTSPLPQSQANDGLLPDFGSTAYL